MNPLNPTGYQFTRYTRRGYCDLCHVVYLWEPRTLNVHTQGSAMGRTWMKADGNFLPCPKGHAVMRQTTHLNRAPRYGYLETIGATPQPEGQ